MANPEHLAILKQGVGVWNKWIDENRRDVIPDLYKADMRGHNLRGAELVGANLSEADLRKADLIGADLIGAELVGADLRWANLIKTDLRWANLSNADLTNADLTNADLLQSQVISTNFNQAILTGSCIKDWQINSETNLDGVICEYIYLEDIFYFGEYESKRRPINGNFAPGEFASLYKKILENTDLILRKTPENDNNINNQGIQFYSNSTIHTWERLRFRSKTEIKIAEALDRTGVLFVPNSLARLNTPKGRANKEADFLICYNGKWGVLEVDGPFHTAERRVEEQERERIFKKNGIKVVERFDSERCYNNPDEVVQEFFKMIEIGYS
ncbi:pentapeptide repeat-containing protein [Dolichospermum lemmermannii CS-548]|uniref:pentapeptide repeat-containing protein n=1 Tax=Dolichospermum lemmermannii TaxID=54295 RepID=UPI00232C88D4|nr:pentapeptide repeat-containing protein [Dolichospermum lemmermannii]MDB9436222.1 pentapeptide repeat-containing protein [Dolichospermum lemmermannii CS-548]